MGGQGFQPLGDVDASEWRFHVGRDRCVREHQVFADCVAHVLLLSSVGTLAPEACPRDRSANNDAGVTSSGSASRQRRRSARAGCRRDRHAWRTPRSWPAGRSDEHTSELQSLMRISYAVFCLKKKINFSITLMPLMLHCINRLYLYIILSIRQ